ncbi:MurR/RpiR family transcriptional regulator [Streptomyces sp. 4503]|uniref:MurR/RpiR family transcriptional regulator n=1 Tax=Streptomyces niphimycinicus TaxID=2842201 RepID=A0ABS6CBP5_9ACTN|nr:MurR/RpiR family transcriptional regulator [Streptomyces niphimycinicus]MBU3864324.1 MurR/RpiR family transcriptional regulator [Streptomyces niphimycinicus]
MAPRTLADEIRQKLGDASPAERKVARVLLAGYPSNGFETIAVIAGRAGVSAPTVLRFVGRLGYSGFPDFQASLRTELDERNASPLSLYESTGYGRPAEQGEEGTPSAGGGLLARGSGIFSAAVAQTMAELPPHDLEHAIQLLSDRKRRITLAGGRFTHLLAQYLGLHLMQLRDDVRFLPDRDVERTAALTQLARRDVLVLFDYRRYEEDKVALAQLAQEHGGKVIVFTDTWLSPTAAHAEVVLPSQVAAPSPYDSFVPTLAVLETVVAGVMTALGEVGHQHMRQGEDTARRIGLV